MTRRGNKSVVKQTRKKDATVQSLDGLRVGLLLVKNTDGAYVIERICVLDDNNRQLDDLKVSAMCRMTAKYPTLIVEGMFVAENKLELDEIPWNEEVIEEPLDMKIRMGEDY